MDNIYNIFDYFSNNVLKNNKKISANEIVQIFIELVLNHKDIKIQKKNKLVLSSGIIIDVNKDNYDIFVELVLKYNFKEKDITEIADRLIEDTERRRKGEFYTPTIWVNEAHKMISEQFGDAWKEEYIVWDCAWGTGNLTRDYKFKELYCSTLNEGDLEIGKKYNNPGTVWNKEGNKFQYDFLNDDVEFFEEIEKVKDNKGYLEESDFKGSKIYKVAPNLIRHLLDGRPLMFFINPPYKNNSSAQSLVSKDSTSIKIDTCIRHLMLSNKVTPTDELYLQFIFRIYKLKLLFKGINLVMYTPSSLIMSEDKKKFRPLILNNFTFLSGTIFCASDFADVKGNWGICLTTWSEYRPNIILDEFNLFVGEVVDDFVNITTKKVFYNMDKNVPCSKWISVDTSNISKVMTAGMSSALKFSNREKYLYYGSLGVLAFNGNKVETNAQRVTIMARGVNGWNLVPIYPVNFKNVVSYFAARKLITGQYVTWVNGKDEYMIPNIEHKLYNLWVNDCIVYSLFNGASNQSSLRQIDYKDKKWDIKNEFFFMSMEDMKALSNEYFNDEVYQDIKEHGEERYVYKILQEVELPQDAQYVLDRAIELTKESFKYRGMFNEDHPEYHINTWDAGWYQIKGLLKEYMPDELKEFNEMYKALGDRMRPLVYELGFLKK